MLETRPTKRQAFGLQRHRLLIVLLALSCCLFACEDQQLKPEPSSIFASPSLEVSEVPKEESLTIKIGSQERVFSHKELLSHPKLQKLTIVDHSAYEDKEMSYLAIPLSTLFEGLQPKEDRVTEYQTKDGFSSSMSPERLLNTSENGAVAYLAVEPPDAPWPKFESRNYGPGPFYVVWTHPELSEIGREEWPFKLTGFRERASLEKRYPKLGPHPSVEKSSRIYSGYKLFIKNCFPCHRLNGQGLASFGPDLNFPHGPTEYMTEAFLKQYIRDPQSVRKWKNGKMPAFPEKELSDQDIELIVEFLAHKAATRG